MNADRATRLRRDFNDILELVLWLRIVSYNKPSNDKYVSCFLFVVSFCLFADFQTEIRDGIRCVLSRCSIIAIYINLMSTNMFSVYMVYDGSCYDTFYNVEKHSMTFLRVGLPQLKSLVHCKLRMKGAIFRSEHI